MHTSESSRKKRNPWAKVVKVRFFWLLLLLVGFILAVPSFPSTESGQVELVVMGLIIFFAAVFVSQGLARIWVMGLLAGAIVVTAAIYMMDGDPKSLLLVILPILLVTLGYTAVSVLSFVLDEGQVNIEHIFGAICAYILIAMAFGTLYYILEILHPGSFSGVRLGASGDHPWWQFVFFSFTTLSTVGYGDILAVTMQARAFAMVEQLVAIFYVAILISRLTGMYTSSDSSSK